MHSGFFHCLNASTIASQVGSSLTALLAAHPGAPVYFLGHSLGAAMATIAAPYAKATLGIKDVRLWTYGSPRTGNLVRHSPHNCLFLNPLPTSSTPRPVSEPP